MSSLNRREFLKTLLCAGLVGCTGDYGRGISYSDRRHLKGEGKLTGEPSDLKPFKFAYVTDSHLSITGKNGAALKAESVKIFEDVLHQINSMKDLNFILFGGDNWDNTDKGTPDVDKFLDMVKDLKVPYLIQFGNREASPMPPGDPTDKKEFVRLFRGHGFREGTFWWDVEVMPGVVVLGLDTSIRGHNDGAMPEEEIQWLKERLEGNGGKFIIVLTHHLFLPTWTPKEIPRWDKNYLIANSERVRPLIEGSRKVKLVLSGHHHVTKIDVINKLPYISSPATVQYPHAFRTFYVNGNTAKLQFHQIRSREIISLGRELLIKEKAQEYGPGGFEDVAAYCMGRPEDQDTVLTVR
ncbi:MAG: metallophosphoesterase family protein [Candidatus Brocadiales bacterium]